jgi:hypothetical protein
MKVENAERRDKKKTKKRSGMQMDNRSIFIILEVQVKKGKKK